jgi:pimeloyl-ACP methyl ester carboxylesterase
MGSTSPTLLRPLTPVTRWSCTATVTAGASDWAEEYGWIIVNVNARGPNFYEGVGDIETLKVIADADARFGIDRSRVYFTGGSMGGSGALRHGLRHPDVFAAVMGVDGWTDYRLWHHHWYARTDCRDDIEEFRRPLLEAASPLYWAARGRWGAIGHIVDGRDTTVLPENGLRLREALWKLGAADLNTHDQLVVYNPTLGHGRGTNHATAYGYFLTASFTGDASRTSAWTD